MVSIAKPRWLPKKLSDILWAFFIGRAIHCNRCGKFMGYMTLVGHKRWDCENCSISGNAEAV